MHTGSTGTLSSCKSFYLCIKRPRGRSINRGCVLNRCCSTNVKFSNMCTWWYPVHTWNKHHLFIYLFLVVVVFLIFLFSCAFRGSVENSTGMKIPVKSMNKLGAWIAELCVCVCVIVKLHFTFRCEATVNVCSSSSIPGNRSRMQQPHLVPYFSFNFILSMNMSAADIDVVTDTVSDCVGTWQPLAGSNLRSDYSFQCKCSSSLCGFPRFG